MAAILSRGTWVKGMVLARNEDIAWTDHSPYIINGTNNGFSCKIRTYILSEQWGIIRKHLLSNSV